MVRTYFRATTTEKQRVLDAAANGENFLLVAEHNGISKRQAYRLVKAGQISNAQWGGRRDVCQKVTPSMIQDMIAMVELDCRYTLQTIADTIFLEHGVSISASTVNRYMLGQLYTVKNTRIESTTMNNEVNLNKRQAYAIQIQQLRREGHMIIFMDETNYNLYCQRTKGRSLCGKRATVELPPSKGKNLQLQCAVQAQVGVIHYATQRGSITMEKNAVFIKEVYHRALSSHIYVTHYTGKKIVIVYDNAPAHSQAESLVNIGGEEDKLMLLRLGPYSPQLNPIEYCFSVLKACMKRHLVTDRQLIVDQQQHGTIQENRMQILKEIVERCMNDNVISPALVQSEELHCQDAVLRAINREPMQMGT